MYQNVMDAVSATAARIGTARRIPRDLRLYYEIGPNRRQFGQFEQEQFIKHAKL